MANTALFQATMLVSGVPLASYSPFMALGLLRKAMAAARSCDRRPGRARLQTQFAGQIRLQSMQNGYF